VDGGEVKGAALASKDRLLRTFRAWSGQHPARPARMARGEPAVLRLIAPLALLLMAAVIICMGLGLVLARQADEARTSENRQSLTAAIVALQAVSPDLARAEPELVTVIEQPSGLKGLRFETAPAGGEREMQSVLDHNGRIIGWFSWEPEWPATAMMVRLLPLAALIALGLAGFAALAMWQLNRLGRKLGESEQQVQKLECEDPLTALPNHNYFFELLDEVLTARGDGETLAFLSLDLDGFDEVNDMLGRAGGDEVLAEIARRLAQALPANAIVGRLGGDEFALALRAVDADAVLQIAHGLRQTVARPIWANQAVHVAASIGFAVAPRDGTTREELMRRADLALRAAKRRGRGSAVAFLPELEAEFQERRFIKREVARALAARAFELQYQPIVAADTGAIAGVEALLRWNHPSRGFIPPSVFIPIAEEAGLMDRLGEFVLRRAIADAERWPGLYVSVNLSPVQVRDRAFIDLVASALAESGLEASRLVLEVTEGVLIDDPDATQARLRELRALGVRLALDDFGSGYSNLGYLQHLPFDKLKIDRSFVTSLDQSANAGVIIQAIVTLGRALGMGVVIEGVETEEQRVLLRLAGCSEMQGYLFYRPTTAQEIGRLLAGAAAEPLPAPVRNIIAAAG